VTLSPCRIATSFMVLSMFMELEFCVGGLFVLGSGGGALSGGGGAKELAAAFGSIRAETQA